MARQEIAALKTNQILMESPVDAAIDRATRIEREEGYGYLCRLLVAVAPLCQPLDTILGVATQIDNYIAGLMKERNDANKELSQIKDQLVECREMGQMARKEIVVLKAALVGT